MNDCRMKQEGFDEEIFDLLFSSADLHNFAEEDRIKYQNRIDFAMDKGREEGREESIEKGIERYHTLLYNKTDGACFGTICFNK